MVDENTAEKAWDEYRATQINEYGSMRVAFMAGRASRDAEVAELQNALYDCYVAVGEDTDGDDSEQIARSWQPYPRLIVDAVRYQVSEAEKESETADAQHSKESEDWTHLAAGYQHQIAEAQANIEAARERLEHVVHPNTTRCYVCDAERILSAPSSTGGAESQGVALIAAERKRQVSEEGYDAEHDKGHARDLVDAGRSYVDSVRATLRGRGHDFYPTVWPWGLKFWKPALDPVRTLVKAGSLIAAAIDSLLAEEGNDHE